MYCRMQIRHGVTVHGCDLHKLYEKSFCLSIQDFQWLSLCIYQVCMSEDSLVSRNHPSEELINICITNRVIIHGRDLNYKDSVYQSNQDFQWPTYMPVVYIRG